ncbi:MAG: hypothetical protein RBU37_10060, partial [Myxococcota bacterium]|nr:hypothetical protein [Myxococcota bacterium]
MKRILTLLAILAFASGFVACDDDPTTPPTDQDQSDTSDETELPPIDQVEQDELAGCRNNDDCASDPNGAICNLSSGDCVECLLNADCSATETCSPQTFTCVPSGCSSDADCLNPDLPACSDSVCVECTTNSHCPAAHFCNTASNTCVPDSGCKTDADCDGALPICNTATGACVECLRSTDCEGTADCVDQACVAITCDNEGFSIDDQSVEGNANLIYYEAYDDGTETFDALTLELYYAQVQTPALNKPGSIELGSLAIDTNYQTCSTCVLLYAGCTEDGGCEKTFFATGGTLHLDAIGKNGTPFQGHLEGVELIEVTIDGNTFRSTPVPGGQNWCIDTVTFDTIMVGDPPVQGCASDDDCSGDTPRCDTTSENCVQCLDASDCDTEQVCTDNVCRTPGLCTYTGFETMSEEVDTQTDYFGYTAYSSISSPSDLLAIEFYYGSGNPPPLNKPGTFTLGSTPEERNYATCGTCVLIYQGCDEGGCDKIFFATGGTLNVTEINTNGSTFVGTLVDAELVEVTIDAQYNSTPVPSGDTWCLPSQSFQFPSGCQSDDDCEPSTPICLEDYAVCVSCEKNSDCTEPSVCRENQCVAPLTCT